MSNTQKKEKTLLYIVRHGESIGNLNREFLGYTNKDLTELGYKQAEKTAEELKNVEFEAIYSSDLQRAYHTAEPHAKMRGMIPIGREDLRELYVGEWEGKKVDDIAAKYGEAFTVEWRQNFGTFHHAKGGEGVQALATRIYGALLDIAKKHTGKTVLVATHAAAIRSFWGIISGIRPEELAGKIPFPTNASYSVVEYKDGELYPVFYSNDSHLKDVKEGKPWY